jgi:hypothetical protein
MRPAGHSAGVSKVELKVNQLLTKEPHCDNPRKGLIMLQAMFARIFTRKTVIRAAFTILSLSGIAHAQAAENAASTSNSTIAGDAAATRIQQTGSYSN